MIHEKSLNGKSAYAISKELGISKNTATWPEPLGLMSWADFLNLTFTGICQWVFLLFFIKYPFVETYRNATGVSEDRNHLVKK